MAPLYCPCYGLEMIVSFILSVVILVCLSIYIKYVAPIPLEEPWAKWGMVALGAIIAAANGTQKPKAETPTVVVAPVVPDRVESVAPQGPTADVATNIATSGTAVAK